MSDASRSGFVQRKQSLACRPPPGGDSDSAVRMLGAELFQQNLANSAISTMRVEHQEVSKTVRMRRIQILFANIQERFVAKCKAARKAHMMFGATDGYSWQYQYR